MKVKKVIGISLIVLAAVMLTAAVVVILSLNTIVTSGINTFGTAATGTKVDIQKVNISLIGGSIELEGLQIANPAGYKEANAFGFGRFYVNLKLKSLLTDKIVIDNIIIEKIAVDLEPSMAKGSNLEEIKTNIMKYCGIDPNAPKPEGKDKTTPAKTEPSSKKGKKVVINNFEIIDGTIIFASKDLGMSAKIPMPKVSIQDIGNQSDEGKPAGEAMLEIYEKTLSSITKSANQGALDSITKDSSKAVKDLGAGAKEGLDKLKNSLGF